MPMRPALADVERYLDMLTDEQAEQRRLLEDLAGIEDCPETDDDIRELVRHGPR